MWPRAHRELAENDREWKDLKSGRVVFYDEDTLQCIEGWTRATRSDRVFLVNRRAFEQIRADGRSRSREFDKYLRRTISGERDLQPRCTAFDSSLHTAPLVRGARGDWDDLMISQLTAAGRPVSIQREQDQADMIRRLFDSALQDARNAANSGKPALEFAAYFVLDTVRATLTMVKAANVIMRGNHAEIPPGTVVPKDRLVSARTAGCCLVGDAEQRVIGIVHTHVLLDPLIDLKTTTVGTKIRNTTTSLHSGVSDVDVKSARNDRLVVYAVDSKWLHRADPDGAKNDELARSRNVRNVLREAFADLRGRAGLSAEFANGAPLRHELGSRLHEGSLP